MTEKQLFTRLMKHMGIALLAFLVVFFGVNIFGSKLLVEPFDGIYPTGDSSRIYYSSKMTAQVEDPEILRVELFDEGVHVFSRIEGLEPGETLVYYLNSETGEEIFIERYKVLFNHTVINLFDGNFSNWELHRCLVFALMLLFTVIIWESFIFTRKKAPYSYHAIFCCGFGIWLAAADFLMLRYLQNRLGMEVMYGVIQRSACEFLFYSIPLLFLFAVALTISNLALIRHEGFSLTNGLGIGLSGAIILGFVVFILIYYSDFSGSEFEYHLMEAGQSSYASLYCLLECFLLGSVICGSLSAKHEPAYDQDYLIILGCSIRDDGTLYPLLKGRVERAIRFQKKQLAKSGKKAVFVPSGGKGDDEPISEGEAMKRYLLEQGYTEEDILAETASKNTIQNMEFSKKLIDGQNPEAKIAFSTTNYHVFRSGIIASERGIRVDGMGAPTKWYFWPNAFIRETIGMITYCWRSLLILLILISAFFAFLAFY